MSNVKNYGLIAVGSEIQFGKVGPRIINNDGTFELKTVGGDDVALTAAEITLSTGDVVLTTGDLKLTSAFSAITIGNTGILELSAESLPKISGISSVVIPVGDTTERGTGELGSLRVNDDAPAAGLLEFYDGTDWVTIDTVSQQAEIDALETSLGAMVDTAGVYVPSALTDTAIWGDGVTNTDLTAGLNNLATYIADHNTLDEIEPGTGAGKVLYLDGSNLWSQALPGATSGVQPYDVGLAALSFKTTTGIMVQTGDDSYGSRTITGTAGQIVITNGDGVSGAPTIGLDDVTLADSGSFVKVTVDTYGRVVGTSAVLEADISGLITGLYVPTSGGSMTGDLTMQSGQGIYFYDDTNVESFYWSYDPGTELTLTSSESGTVLSVLSTGLAVTGTLGVSGPTTLGTSAPVGLIQTITSITGDRFEVYSGADTTGVTLASTNHAASVYSPFYIQGSNVSLTSTGLSVTGTLSATGQISGRSTNGTVFSSTNAVDADFTVTIASGKTTIRNSASDIAFTIGATERAILSPTGLSVTGTLGITGDINQGTIRPMSVSNGTIYLNNETSGAWAQGMFIRSNNGAINVGQFGAYGPSDGVADYSYVAAQGQDYNTATLKVTSTGTSVAGGISASGLVTANNSTFNAISQALHIGAIVKAIVYDTSKDTGGSAWTMRCADKSWYTETLGGDRWLPGGYATIAAAWTAAGSATGAVFQASATAGPLTIGKYYVATSATTATEVFRGISREFPALAGIVAESAKVVIYDLTAPGCPMWMVFTSGGTFGTGYLSGGAPLSLTCLNGELLVGTTAGSGIPGLVRLKFLSDRAEIWRSAGGYGFSFSQGLASRNQTLAGVPNTSYLIVNSTVNDVAITVLENAPINPATGLPVPTIAVATAGGVSVIKQDGTVVTYASNPWSQVSWFSQSILSGRRGGATNSNFQTFEFLSFPAMTNTQLTSPAMLAGTVTTDSANRSIAAASAVVNAGSSGFSVLKHDPTAPAKGMVDYVTNAYNSGWMVGDIRGAWLADTTAETITATELVTNGTFTTNTDGWTGNTATLTAPSGELLVTSGAGSGWASQAITTVVGSAYRLTGGVRNNTATAALLYVGTSNGNASLGSFSTTSTSTVDASMYFVASGTTTYIGAQASGAAGTAYFDNISLLRVVADRSIKNVGLSINGTLTKTAVASGAGLVAYSGFSTSNYFEQPYNSALDFGTGDFCVMGWVKENPNSAIENIVDRYTGSGARFFVSILSGGQMRFHTFDGTTTNNLDTTSVLDDGVWHFVCASKLSGVKAIYVDGVITGSATPATNATLSAAAVFTVGAAYDHSSPLTNGSLTLWRITATAPSADQIAHIYRTELPLFQANAQCTLAGTSTAVTALAHDDTTEILHVGTSWGRSGFQNLLRVDSEATTTGALTSLSASQGAILTGGTSGKYYQPPVLLRDTMWSNTNPQETWTSGVVDLSNVLNYAATLTIASATTTDIGAATSNAVIISGTTTITGLGTVAAGATRDVTFSGALTLTHNATSLILPGGANITTTAGDSGVFQSLGSGNWRCTSYQKAIGTAVVTPINAIDAATGARTVENGNNPIVWNWTQSTASQIGFRIGETTGSTGGSGSQVLCTIGTTSGSTADPLQVRCRAVDVIRVSRVGAINITGLDGPTGLGTTGSAVTITGGAAASTSVGGAISITTGAGGATSGTSGALTISCGTTISGAGGALSISSGIGGGAGTGGALTIAAGNGGASGIGGALNLTAGNGNSAVGGDLTLTVGTGSANGAVNFVNTNVANGSVATTFTSLGPTGANLTIVGWLKIKVGGTTQYVPYW